MNVNAGDAVVLDDSIVHYSAENKTDGLRLTIQLILIPEETESIHYHRDPQGDPNEVTIYEVDHEFYMQFHPWLKPTGKVIGKRPFQARDLNHDQFLEAWRAPRFDTLSLDERPLGSAAVEGATAGTSPAGEPAAEEPTSDAPDKAPGIWGRIKKIFA